MSSKHFRMLRSFTYGSTVVLWSVAIYLIMSGDVLWAIRVALDWLVYFGTALAWATGGTVAFVWKYFRDFNELCKPQVVPPGTFAYDWTTDPEVAYDFENWYATV